MSLSLLIATVDKTAKWFLPFNGGEARFERRPGGRSPASFTVYDRNGASGYRPDAGQAVEFRDGGVAVMTGQLSDVDEDGLTDLDTGVMTAMTVLDNQTLPGRTSYTVTYAAGTVTLKQILQDLVANPLAVFGITLDPAQATGAASFADLIYTNATPETILNDLQTITGWIWRVTPGLVLRMIAPATEACGFTLSDTAGAVLGKVRKRKTRSSNYGNTLILRCGPTGPQVATQPWTADGVATSWEVDIQTVLGGWIEGVVRENGVARTVSGPGGGGWYEWDETDGRGTISMGTGPTPGAGVALTFTYTAQYPFYVTVSDAPTVALEGPFVVPGNPTREDILVYATGLAYATALLRIALATPWIVTVQHRAGLAWPGQTVPLSFAERAILGTYMILSVIAETDVDGELVYTFECLEGNELQPTWVDYFKGMASGGGGGGGGVSGGFSVVTPTVLSGPVTLGGSRNNSLAVGTTSTPVYDWMPFECLSDQSVQVRVTTRARVGGVSVTPILTRWTGAVWAAHATGAPAAGTTESEQFIPTALTAGELYRLECLTGTAGASAYCIGQLENL